MNFKKIFIVVALLSVVSARSAEAGLVEFDTQAFFDFYGASESHPVSYGLSGTETFVLSPEAILAGNGNKELRTSGYIPSNATITLSYNTSGFYSKSELVLARGAYDFFDEEGNHLQGYMENRSTTTRPSVMTDSSASALVFVSASFETNDPTKATTIIKNNSAGVVFFNTLLTQTYIAGPDARMELGYEISPAPVSPVPVPAALPLFAFGMAGVAGVRLRRRKA